jgi:hypothetical protein
MSLCCVLPISQALVHAVGVDMYVIIGNGGSGGLDRRNPAAENAEQGQKLNTHHQQNQPLIPE